VGEKKRKTKKHIRLAEPFMVFVPGIAVLALMLFLQITFAKTLVMSQAEEGMSSRRGYVKQERARQARQKKM